MRLLLVSFTPAQVQCFEELGCEVHVLNPPPESETDVAGHARKQGIAPDLLIQREFLGPRRLLSGLDAMECPTLFWSLDTHLNLFWQRHYARLFDGVLTTQSHLAPRMEAWGGPRVGVCPWSGWVQPSPPFSRRRREAGFVGRITPQRAARANLAGLIQARERSEVAQGLKFQEMMAFYQDTRAVPNEAILGEVNLRLFEAASCGCLVLCQDLGESQNGLFAPGKEIEVYADGLELSALLDRARRDPAWAERMGRAARARVLSEHLFEHRARRMLDFGRGLAQARLLGRQAERRLALAAFELWRSDMCSGRPDPMEARLLRFTPDVDVSMALLRLFMAAGQQGKAGAAVEELFTAPPGEGGGRLDLNLCCSMAALRLGRSERARQFLLRQLKAEPPARRVQSGDDVELLLAWARIMAGHHVLIRHGYPFNAGESLPATALECLLEAHRLAPANQEVLRRLDALLAGVKGMEYVRMGFVSWRTLHKRKDWRLGLSLGELNLKTFRLQQGLDEIALARLRAEQAGQESRFMRALEGRDSQGLLRAALKW